MSTPGGGDTWPSPVTPCPTPVLLCPIPVPAVSPGVAHPRPHLAHTCHSGVPRCPTPVAPPPGTCPMCQAIASITCVALGVSHTCPQVSHTCSSPQAPVSRVGPSLLLPVRGRGPAPARPRHLHPAETAQQGGSGAGGSQGGSGMVWGVQGCSRGVLGGSGGVSVRVWGPLGWSESPDLPFPRVSCP